METDLLTAYIAIRLAADRLRLSWAMAQGHKHQI